MHARQRSVMHCPLGRSQDLVRDHPPHTFPTFCLPPMCGPAWWPCTALWPGPKLGARLSNAPLEILHPPRIFPPSPPAHVPAWWPCTALSQGPRCGSGYHRFLWPAICHLGSRPHSAPTCCGPEGVNRCGGQGQLLSRGGEHTIKASHAAKLGGGAHARRMVHTLVAIACFCYYLVEIVFTKCGRLMPYILRCWWTQHESPSFPHPPLPTCSVIVHCPVAKSQTFAVWSALPVISLSSGVPVSATLHTESV